MFLRGMIFLSNGSRVVVVSTLTLPAAFFSSPAVRATSPSPVHSLLQSSMVSKLFSLPWQPPKMKSLQRPSSSLK